MPVVSGGWFSLFFWRFWKWILRLFTRRCELQRICSKETNLPDRTQRIAISLKNSKNKTLRTLVTERGSDYKPEEAVGIILRAKNIAKEKDPNFVLCLEPSLYQIVSLNLVKSEVHNLVKEKYSKENAEHEKQLIKLWSLLMPQTALQSRLTKQWGDIGFQGNDPATDFRGMGIFGLHCLVYFAECYNDKARKVLGNSQHPTKGYPLAIAGINITSTMVTWLKDGVMDYYFFVVTKDREGVTRMDFYDAYCFVMYSFNQYWIDSDPENVMEFPRIKELFAKEIEKKLTEKPITIRLVLDS